MPTKTKDASTEEADSAIVSRYQRSETDKRSTRSGRVLLPEQALDSQRWRVSPASESLSYPRTSTTMPPNRPTRHEIYKIARRTINIIADRFNTESVCLVGSAAAALWTNIGRVPNVRNISPFPLLTLIASPHIGCGYPHHTSAIRTVRC